MIVRSARFSTGSDKAAEQWELERALFRVRVRLLSPKRGEGLT